MAHVHDARYGAHDAHDSSIATRCLLSHLFRSQECKDNLVIANILGPRQFTLSGSSAACDEVERLATNFGARGARRLPVSGAFHSKYMQVMFSLLFLLFRLCNLQ